MPNKTVKNGIKAKKIKLPQMNFHVPIGPFHSAKFEFVPFLGLKWPICHKQNFYDTNCYHYFRLPIEGVHLTLPPIFCLSHGACYITGQCR